MVSKSVLHIQLVAIFDPGDSASPKAKRLGSPCPHPRDRCYTTYDPLNLRYVVYVVPLNSAPLNSSPPGGGP